MAAMLRARLNRFVHEAFVAALTLFMLLLPLAPLHQLNTRHHNVSRVVDHSRLEFELGEGSNLKPGRELGIYRFNPGWRAPIGRAVLERIESGKAVARYDAAGFSWPMGIQGSVVELRGGFARIDIGDQNGLRERTELNVYRARTWVGRLRVRRVRTHDADCVIERRAHADLLGATVSPYTIPTQVAYLNAPWVMGLEYAVLVLFGLFVLGRLWQRDRYARIAQMIRGLLARLRKAQLLIHVVIGPPAIYVLVSVSLLAVAHVGAQLAQVLAGTSMAPPLASLWNTLSAPSLRLPASLLVGTLYYLVLLRKRRSPLGLLWQRLRYRPPTYRWFPWHQVRSYPWLDRFVLNWVLQLLLAYAFAHTLWGFLASNLAAMGDLGWRDLGLDFHDPAAFLPSLGAMLASTPDYKSSEALFGIVRLALFSVTIVGCIVGYGHSIVSILWTKSIRNVDFTLLGWITNGVCYGPLLGTALWRFVYPAFGSEPGITEGPLYHAIFAADLFLNLLYTLSIWNLGTMFGVMVDKGVRRSAFFSVVRHPNYTLEAAMFYVSFLPDMTKPAHYLSGLTYFITYWIRSEREDMFMTASNPEYAQYKKAVPWKFVPGIY